MSLIDHVNTVATSLIGNIEGWEPFCWEVITDNYLVEGGIPTVVRGRKKWGRDTRRVIVTKDQVIAERQRYEAETGNCGECMGTKQTLKSCGVTTGPIYRPCRECNGTGKAHTN